MSSDFRIEPDLAQAVIDKAEQVKEAFLALHGAEMPADHHLAFDDPRFVNANNSMVSLITCQGHEEIACMLFEHSATDDGVSVDAARAWLTIDGTSIEFNVDLIGNKAEISPRSP